MIDQLTWEGYSACRVVWFSHKQGVVPDLTPSVAGTAQQDLALLNLDNLREPTERGIGGGVLLETHGESDIDNASWAKDTAAPAGVFSLTLKPRQNYVEMIRPSDVLLVFMNHDKYGAETFISLISVDTVGETRLVDASGATVDLVSVQGRDLGKVLMETPLMWDPAFAQIEAVMRLFPEFIKGFTAELTVGGPSRVVQEILSVFFSLKQTAVTRLVGKANVPRAGESTTLKQWLFPGHDKATLLSLLDAHSFVQSPMVGATYADEKMLQSAGNLWQLCEMYANRLVNEFFIDTRDLVPGYDWPHQRTAIFAQRFIQRQTGNDGSADIAFSEQFAQSLVPDFNQPTASLPDLSSQLGSPNISERLHKQADIRVPVIALVHRQLPYDTFTFRLLPTTVVQETEVFDSNINRSNHEVFNLFRVRMPGIVEGLIQEQEFGVHLNRRSMEKHGVRLFEGETIFPFTNSTDRGKLINGSVQGGLHEPVFQFYIQLLTTWHAFNENFLTGALTLRFRPDIRCGTRLTLVRSHTGHVQVIDFYVQSVQHNFSSKPGGSRTTVQLIRGVDLEDATVEKRPEAFLFWTDKGRQLPRDPYEIVTPEGILVSRNSQQQATASGATADPTDLPTGGVEPGAVPRKTGAFGTGAFGITLDVDPLTPPSNPLPGGTLPE